MPLWDNIVNSKWPFILATLVGYPALLHVDMLSSVEFDFFPLSFFVSFPCFIFRCFNCFQEPFVVVLFCLLLCIFFHIFFSLLSFFFSSYFCLTASQGSVIDIP